MARKTPELTKPATTASKQSRTRKSRAKAQEQQTKPTVTFTPRSDADGCIYFERQDLLEYVLREQKYLNVQMAKQLKHREKQELLDRLERELHTLRVQEQSHRQALLVLRQQYNEKYDVQMDAQGFRFDDETGRILDRGK